MAELAVAPEWVAETANKLIAQDPVLKDLAQFDIAYLTKPKAPKGGLVQVGKAQKTTEQLQLLAEKDYKFVITLGWDAFQEMTPLQCEALLYRLLMCCQVEWDEETDEPKFSIRKFDVSAFEAELQKYGIWWKLDQDGNPTTLEVFGDKSIILNDVLRQKWAAANTAGVLTVDYILAEFGLSLSDLKDGAFERRPAPVKASPPIEDAAGTEDVDEDLGEEGDEDTGDVDLDSMLE